MRHLARAYLDDYDRIVVNINKSFYEGRSSRFYLLDGDKSVLLEVKSSLSRKDKNEYTLVLPYQLTIGREYRLMLDNGYSVELFYRFITKTYRFNCDYYYPGNDLGSRLEEGKTSFCLWAPTASDVLVNIEHEGQKQVLRMHRFDRGVYRLVLNRNLKGAVYTYMVRVNGQWNETPDPYGKASLVNSRASVVADLNEFKANEYELPEFKRYVDAVIYETSIRDISASGTFNGLNEDLDYLKDLGITHLQLMPVNDFGSVDELHPENGYNWGYDPMQYQVLEGSYSSDPANPLQAPVDFAALCDRIHDRGLRVVLDVVFNHVYSVVRNAFDLTVPYYYFRYFGDGRLSDGSYCGNDVDTGMLMARKYILDTLKYYVNQFKVDGFRFDLMGIIDRDTIEQAKNELKAINPDIILYGEGWEMPTALAPELAATKSNILDGIAYFNDSFREIIKGSTFDSAMPGFASGNVELAEGAGNVLKGMGLGDPNHSINYVECHDDMTVYDKLHICCLHEKKTLQIARQKLMLGCVILAQGIPFIHSGQEACRSKQGLSNTYNSPDYINKIKKEDRDHYKDVVDFTRELLALRKERRIALDKQEIEENVSFEVVDKALVYRIKNRNLLAIFNETLDEISYTLPSCSVIIFDGEKRSWIECENEIKVRPLSLTVFEVANDQ